MLNDSKYFSVDELDEKYRKADEVDREIFAEMRTNVRLVSGDHYNETHSKYWERIRESEDLLKQTKLRLTKNHSKKIRNEYVSVFLTHAPGTMAMPVNPEEVQDQKAAQLNNSVLTYFKRTLNLRHKTREQADHYFDFGEVFEKIFWDPDIGKVVDYEPLLNEDGSLILETDENGNKTGNVVRDPNKPIMEGGFVIDNLLPFDMLRCPYSQSWEESPYFINRKMVPNDVLKAMVPPSEHQKVFGNTETSYFVFNNDSSKYEATKEKTLVREFYFKVCKQFPNGYFFITTKNYILAEGELPLGIFPINYTLFDKIPTSARGRSPIKTMRPYQVEINRCASAIATAQITTGDDKILVSYGSKISNGGQLPGLRGVAINGSIGDVKVVPGRTGDQYLPYMQNQIQELYGVMDVSEELYTDKEGKLDPYAMLFHASKNRKKFSKYTEAFCEFKIREAEMLLELAKFYLPESIIIPVIGSCEQVNLAEFKNTKDNKFVIRVEQVDTDAETMLGKQLSLNHTLQYVGTQLSKEEIGKIVRAMPYLNEEEAFDDLTIDYDSSKNEILAIERGEVPNLSPYDNHQYAIKRLSNRMKKSDFRFLDPKIQDLFHQMITIHEEEDVKQKQEIQRMQQGFIPTDGYMVVCDFYVAKPNGKQERVKIPYNAIKWLIDQIQAQGQNLEQLDVQNQGALAEMSRMMTSKPPAQQPPNQGPASPQPGV